MLNPIWHFFPALFFFFLFLSPHLCYNICFHTHQMGCKINHSLPKVLINNAQLLVTTWNKPLWHGFALVYVLLLCFYLFQYQFHENQKCEPFDWGEARQNRSYRLRIIFLSVTFWQKVVECQAFRLELKNADRIQFSILTTTLSHYHCMFLQISAGTILLFVFNLQD